MADAAKHIADGRAKVVVLVGFLGAGKTTLLRHLIISEEDMTGTVVIVNEFGDVGFDGSLIKRLDSDVIELVSGCVCCTLVADLTLTLQRILDDLDQGTRGPPPHDHDPGCALLGDQGEFRPPVLRPIGERRLPDLEQDRLDRSREAADLSRGDS
jgi:hypothetical protein